MSEREFDHWLNLSSEQQMQTLDLLIRAGEDYLDCIVCACRSARSRCFRCRLLDALALLEGRPSRAGT